MLHGTFTHLHMHVANVEYSETVKRRWQLLEHNVVALDENAFCIPACSPVETGQPQCVSNDRMDRIPALYVKGEEALAEDLRLVVRLDANRCLACSGPRRSSSLCKISVSTEQLPPQRLDLPCC